MGFFGSKNRGRRSLAEQQKTQVTSYYSKRSLGNRNLGRKISEEASGTKHTSRRRLVSTFILLIIVGLVGYSLMLDTEPRLRLIQSENVVHHSDEYYQEGISDIWRQELSSRLKVTVNSSQLKQKILEQYPEIADISINLPIAGKKPTIVLTPERAVLQITNSQGGFYANDQGKILASTGQISSLNNPSAVPEVIDQSGLELTPGTFVLSQSNVQTINTLLAGLQKSGSTANRLVLPPIINELDISIDNKPYIIKFSLLEEPEQGVGAYLAFLETIKGQAQPQEYVDLRVPEKAFYK